jgi:hypothetical protein
MFAEEDEFDRLERIALQMIAQLQEHGWDFSLGRDPVLILIEYEEIIQNGEPDE